MSDRLLILSASAISTLKACPRKYYNQYVLGIRPAVEPEARRMGSSWHEGQEVMYYKPGQKCPRCVEGPVDTCPVCLGSGTVPKDPLDAMARVLSQRYETLSPAAPKATLETERIKVMYALFAYRYHYDDKQPIDTITTELPFRIPLIDPRTRKAVPNAVIDGKLDKLIAFGGTPAVMEHKSTSDDVSPESDYWGHLRLDTQTLIYTYAAQRLQADGLLEQFGIKADDQPVGSILYDVWRKPAIKPKALSQADTAKFIETGEYFGRKFEVFEESADPGPCVITVDGEKAEVEALKKGFAIRETPDMYGCRLFNEINEQPDRYFARRLITRTSEDIGRFEWELFSLYQSIAAHQENQSWFHNENECNSYGRCDYCQFCYTGQQIDPKKPPAGFVNIFAKKGDR